MSPLPFWVKVAATTKSQLPLGRGSHDAVARDRHRSARDPLENRHALVLSLVRLDSDQRRTRQPVLGNQDGLRRP
jgi:hypothetical protein